MPEHELDYRIESRGLLRYARYYGKLLAVAWQISSTDYDIRSRKTAIAEKWLRKTNSSRQLINLALNRELRERKLVGIGMQSIVLQRGGAVLKKSTDAFGQREEVMQYEIERVKRDNQVLGEALGDMSVPTDVAVDTLQLSPLPRLRSVTIYQAYVPYMFDVYHASSFARRDASFQNDLGNLIDAINYMSQQGQYLDIIGPNNIVVENGTNRLKVVDTALLPAHTLRGVNTTGTKTQQVFYERLEALRQLQG